MADAPAGAGSLDPRAHRPLRPSGFRLPSPPVCVGDVEGPAGAAIDALTVAAIDGHPFGTITFTGDRWALPDVRLLSPILPSKVVAIGRNYADHAKEMGGEATETPLIFLKPSTSVIGTGDMIRLPATSQRGRPRGRARGGDRPPGHGRRRARGACRTCSATRPPTTSPRATSRAPTCSSPAPRATTRSARSGPWIETVLDPSDLRGHRSGQRRDAAGRAHQRDDPRRRAPDRVHLRR